MPQATAPHAAAQAPQPPAAGGDALPTIATGATADQILDRLAVASRRGRLAGFDRNPGDGALFAAAAHAHPFDSQLLGQLAGGRVTFRLRMLRKMPLLFAAILAFTIWPGVWFMDELVSQLGLWRADHPWLTYYWYLPLTVLPLPWVWNSAMRRSRRSALEHARETIAGIARELGGTVEP